MRLAPTILTVIRSEVVHRDQSLVKLRSMSAPIYGRITCCVAVYYRQKA